MTFCRVASSGLPSKNVILLLRIFLTLICVPSAFAWITNLDELKLFRWRATMMVGFVMTNDKEFQLEETSMGKRRIHKELFSGMLVPLFFTIVESKVSAMLNSINEALKVKAEGIPD